MPALIEMSRWQVEGHGFPALVILGRMAGYPEASIKPAQREPIIAAALKRK